MYFIEILVNFFKKKKQKNNFNPLDTNNSDSGELPDSENCEHIFMPIDSSGETLACSKCGLVVNKKDLKKKNIFKI